MELEWKIYELPESSRIYHVEGTTIHKLYGALPDPKHGYYKTRNEAKRAVARYRKESKDYWYSHPGSPLKNVQKQIKIAFDETWEKIESVEENFDLSKPRTVKIAKIKAEGLSEYKRAGGTKDENKND